MWLLCALVGHRRSAGRAKFDYEAQQWESICKRCGVPMSRVEHGKWRVKSELDETHKREPV